MESQKDSVQIFIGDIGSESAWVIAECTDEMKFKVRCLACGHEEPNEPRPDRCPRCNAKMINHYC